MTDEKIISLYDNIKCLSNISDKGLLSPHDETNRSILEKLTYRELSGLKTILVKPNLIEIIKYFKEYPASTIQAAIKITGIPESSVFRAFKELKEIDFIDSVSRAKYPRKGGSMPYIYATRAARPEDIAQASLIHLRATQPIYSAVQLTLKACEGFTTSARFSEIVALARPYSKGFRLTDVAELAARDLRDRGVKIWR